MRKFLVVLCCTAPAIVFTSHFLFLLGRGRYVFNDTISDLGAAYRCVTMQPLFSLRLSPQLGL